MKLHFSNLKLVGTDRRAVRTDVPVSVAPAVRPCPQRGIALIITLILLAVVTVMAVAFLANSRRERGSVTTATDTAGARLAADAALAQAESQIMANTLATTNPYNFGLIVSTNYLPPTTGDPLDDLANMLISPRAPVWLSNTVTHVMENRFYLDLNRNGVDDPNQNDTNFVAETNSAGILITNIGDPEWIGVLDHPDQPHGPNNRFIARYAFAAMPIGNALDLNAIYNDAIGVKQNASMTGGNDGFMRNQGAGSWEINLAAFFADLNTNEWDSLTAPNPGYFYNEWMGSPNTGYGFEDALSLLGYRYDYSYNNLFWVLNLFGPNGVTAFQNDDIDGYSDGPLMTNTFLPFENDNASSPWAGADNTNQFFDMQELFDTNETERYEGSPGFTDRLLDAGSDTNSTDATYNRYTFYRLLSQMGVASAPEQDKMNLNYDNLDIDPATGTASATNFVPWTALGFFTNAADRMLRAYSQDWLARDPSNYVASYELTNAFGITNIPVLVSNQFVYSSAINRVLQLAANMYDATTNNTLVMGRNFPSVFRPTFNVVSENGYNDVYVDGYEQVFSVSLPNDEMADGLLAQPTNATDLAVGNDDNVNVYGVPWIIGAKKGFPNFNEFSMEQVVGVTRRLQVTRTTNSLGASTLTGTNQMYTMAINNSLGVECWNSYASNYPDPVQIVVRDNFSGALTNDDGMTPVSFNNIINNAVNPGYWPGTTPWFAGMPNTNSFDIPLLTSIPMTLNDNYAANTNWWEYRFDDSPPDFVPIPPTPNLFETNITGFPFPHFGLLTTNRLQVFMLDGTNVIDYVQFSGPDSSLDINTNLFTDSAIGNGNIGVWNTNLSTTGVPDGVANQIQISKGDAILNTTDDGTWNRDPEAVPLGGTIPQQQAYFNGFFEPRNIGSAPSLGDDLGATATNTDLSVEAPYEPTRYVVLYTTWQANDPLVHYLASDLNYMGESSGGLQPGVHTFNYGQTNSIPIMPNLGKLNDHYTPWGGNPPTLAEQQNISSDTNANDYNAAIKDPLIAYSDNWDFPANKFPTVGWLGRVHRGTPWQTVDMKSALPSLGNWATNWTGDLNPFDADNSSPSADWQLFDLFTTAFNDNATRGQLSVNVGAPNGPSLAAWSALFSGVVVVTNTTGGYTVIQPAGAAGASSSLEALVANINQTRSTFTNADGLTGTFEHVGDVLAAPYLTVSNQWLLQNNNTNTITDEMYEWLPQQVLSLLRDGGTPQSPMRYVIYCYGQTLKPAPNGIVTGGSEFGLCTNYQVVAEADTRAVVQFNSTRTNNIFPPDDTNAPISINIWTSVPSVTNNNAVIKSFNVLPPD